MAFAAITTIALSLGILGAFMLSAMSAGNFTNEQIGKFQIAVFTKTNATSKEAQAVFETLRKVDGVEKVVMRPRDKEWAQLKRERPDIESAGLPLNPLPYAMDVKVTDPAKTTIVASEVRKITGVEKVKDGRETLGRVLAVANVVRALSIVGVVILLATAIFIISNAIRLTLYARRHEIRIMKLVGATNNFVKVPLVIEGMIFGTLGAIVAWLIMQAGLGYLGHLAQNIKVLAGSFSSGVDRFDMLAGLVVLGFAIGAAGSAISIRRFLME